MIKKNNVILAIILTLLTILISYKTSEEIKSIVNENDSTKNSQTGINETIIEKPENFATSNKTNVTSTSSSSLGSVSYSSNQKTISEEKKALNYSLLESAYIYDFCILNENELVFEGGASKCLNIREPYKFLIKNYDNFITIFFDEKTYSNYTKKDRILIGFAYAKNFIGVESLIKNVFSNSSAIEIGNFYFGERIEEGKTTEVYLYFPIYISSFENSTNFIFVETELKNYLIGKIEIEVI